MIYCHLWSEAGLLLDPTALCGLSRCQADKGQIKDLSLSSVKVKGQVGHSWIHRLLSVRSIDHYTVENRHNSSLEPINHAWATWWSHPSSTGHQTCLSCCSNNPLCLRKRQRRISSMRMCADMCQHGQKNDCTTNYRHKEGENVQIGCING